VNRGDLESNPAIVLSQATTAAGSAGRECSAGEAALVRLQALAQLLDDIASAQGTSTPPSVLAECFARWQSELEAGHRRFLQLAEREPMTSGALEQARAALEAGSKVRQRLIQAGVVDEDTLAVGGGELALESADESAFYFEVVGRGTELEIVQQPGEPRRAAWRTAIASGIVGITLLLWMAVQFAAARDWLAAHGHFVMAGAGIVWWLVAPLGWLGWPLVIAAAWLAVMPPKRETAFDGGSTLRRFSNSHLR
jgi:hypothetical protein